MFEENKEIPINAKCINNLKSEFSQFDCNDENMFNGECNKLLLKKEVLERKCTVNDDNNLYPTLNDTNFNIKIASKKEFQDTKYDGVIYDNIKEYADELSNLDFELEPHQQFVKNFLSFQTPYNSLLLFHGLGSGKTCSAIGVCEEMRNYMKQSGLFKPIIIVASKNVQDNFKLQLFDETKIALVNNVWTINSCVGNTLIKEINPTSNKALTKDKIIRQIKALINKYYIFLGYGQFANYIIKVSNVENIVNKGGKNINSIIRRKLKKEFDERLIVIDEIHNIRKSEDNENKKVAINLELLVKNTDNMRLLFLSATPMYNSYKEMVWLLNVMNMNDRRGKIDVSQVFDNEGNFKEHGEELLVMKSTGYVSFVRGENPYTFPYRVYPNLFAKQHTFPYYKYPSYQMNLKKISEECKSRILSIYLNQLRKCDKKCGKCQYCIYIYLISYMRNKEYNMIRKGKIIKLPSFQNMEKFGYTHLQDPLRALVISYPYDKLSTIMNNVYESNDELKQHTPDIEEDDSSSPISEIIQSGGNFNIEPDEFTGKKGLMRIMNFEDSNTPPLKGHFTYKEDAIEKYGKIFSYDKIGDYSVKIKCLLDSITKNNTVAEGVILVYSQYLDGGLIPIALALEEMGFTRYGNDVKSLFKSRETPIIDVRTMKAPIDKKDFIPAKYSLITGDKRISPDNDFEVKAIINDENINGNKVKVILISRSGAEGIDFKYIRQIHIMEPWYNLNRIEQIIGRGVRNKALKKLPFEKRNVQIFIHGTILGEDNEEEAADLYVYRFAELKATLIGKVTRLLKENSVDCILNHDQTNFTQENFSRYNNIPVKQILSTGLTINDFKIGDTPYSSACDYMENCDYNCIPDNKVDEINMDTYNEYFIHTNNDKIIQKIKMLIKNSFFYKKKELIHSIQTPKKYPLVQIYAALSKLINDDYEYINDRYGRPGRLINVNEYYLFQPLELHNKNISIFERSVPIDYKNTDIVIELDNTMIDHHKPAIDINNTVDKLMEQLLYKYDVVKEYNNLNIVARGDNDWYKYAGVVINKFSIEYPEMIKYFNYLVTSHIIEELFFSEKYDILNYVFSLDNIPTDTFIWEIKNYFDKQLIISNNNTYFIMFNLDKIKVLMLQNNKWKDATREDLRTMIQDKDTNYLLKLDINKYNKYIGFMGYNRKNTALVFKTKDMEAKRDSGAYCEEAGKEKSIQKLNLILNNNKYTSANTKQIKDNKGKVIQRAITQIELCVMQEFILRYYNIIIKDDKHWFINPELALYFKLYKLL